MSHEKQQNQTKKTAKNDKKRRAKSIGIPAPPSMGSRPTTTLGGVTTHSFYRWVTTHSFYRWVTTHPDDQWGHDPLQPSVGSRPTPITNGVTTHPDYRWGHDPPRLPVGSRPTTIPSGSATPPRADADGNFPPSSETRSGTGLPAGKPRAAVGPEAKKRSRYDVRPRAHLG